MSIKQCIVLILCLISFQVVSSADLSFQFYVYDVGSDDTMNTDDVTLITASFVDENGIYYKETSQDQIVENGVINVVFSIDLTDENDVNIFDQPGLQVYVEFTNLNDSFVVNITTMPISVYSLISDRMLQISDTDFLEVDYDNYSISISTESVQNSLTVSGDILADKFVGNGYYLTGVQGLGLNDDHSLEKNMSRTLPNALATDDSDMGEDVVYVSNEPNVGIGTTSPTLPFDVQGRVLFSEGEESVGLLSFPLDTNSSYVVWDKSTASFKAGYVSRDISVSSSAFRNSSVAIGNDTATLGVNSTILGGYQNYIDGNYSAIVGGKENILEGNYSLIVGSESDAVYKSYVTSINGMDNYVSSNFSVLISSSSNVISSGEFNMIYGTGNVLSGDTQRAVILQGFGNQILDSDDVLIFGNDTIVNHDSSWIINLTEDSIESIESNQVAWFASNGVSINTDNVSEELNVSGSIQADYFYGDGSGLTNLSLVDQYWFMYDYDMTIVSYNLSINTSTDFINSAENRLNLKYGLVLSDDGTTDEGTIAFTGTDFVGYTGDGETSLIGRDFDTLYEFSDSFEEIDGVVGLVTTGVEEDDYFVFDGDSWVISQKSYWTNGIDTVSHDRPISLWNETFDGMLNLMNTDNNRLVFVNEDETKGLTIQNVPIEFGFNLYDLDDGYNRFDLTKHGYTMQVDIVNGSFNIFSFENELNPLFSVNRNGNINFLDSDLELDINVPTQSQVSNMVIDSGTNSQLLNMDFTEPFLKSDSDGELFIQASNSSTINLRILEESGSIIDMNRIQITDDGEFLLSDDDSQIINQPMFTLPDGNMIIDSGYNIAVYDEDRNVEVGMGMNYDSVQFYPDDSDTNTVTFSNIGLGIRTSGDGILSIRDDTDTDVFLSKGQSKNRFLFTIDYSTQWIFDRYYKDSYDQFIIQNALQEETILFYNSQININDPASPSKDININGDLEFVGDMQLMLTGNSVGAGAFATIVSDYLTFQPISDVYGIELESAE